MNQTTVSYYKNELKVLENILVLINDSLLNFYKGDLTAPTFYAVHDIKSYTKEKIEICKDNISASESMLQNNHIQESLMNEKKSSGRK